MNSNKDKELTMIRFTDHGIIAPISENFRMQAIRLAAGFLVFAGLSLSTAFADTLTVEVRNVIEAGKMHLAIYDDADVFENDDGEKGGKTKGVVDGVIEDVTVGSVTYTFDLPKGTYAIGIFVDTNDNNAMDRTFFGNPKEQYGFSNNAKGTFGPPSFEKASFSVNGDTLQSIDL